MAKGKWCFGGRAQWTLFCAVAAISWVCADLKWGAFIVVAVAGTGAIVATLLLRKYPPP